MDDQSTTSLKCNERTVDLRRNSKKKRRKRCNEGMIAESLYSGELHHDTKQDARSELSEEVRSKLSRSVVSLALSDGHMVLFACSGVAIQCEGCVARFVTTASLVKALNDKKGHDNLMIEVRHEDNVVLGFLEEHDFGLNIAVVNVKNIPDVCAISFPRKHKDFLRHSKVASLGRDTSGQLIVTNGTWSKVTLSTCKSKNCEGGPLIDFDGTFIGVNLSLSAKGTTFLPLLRVFLLLDRCKWLENIEFPSDVGERLTGENSNSHQVPAADVLDNDLYGDLESLGYPERPKSASDGSMVLLNNFEDSFGDIFGTGVWSELSETVLRNIQENTVALASFYGGKRLFACTGFFIDWNGCATILTSASLLRNSGCENKIVENLKIKVLHKKEQYAEGTLLHYNLHYNVALVSVKDSPQPAKLEHQWNASCELLAVGRNFRSGELMGAKGIGTPTLVIYDCRLIRSSTCGITKAGIGGPLFAFDGKFVGMNFYNEEGGETPFLPAGVIFDVLNNFKTKRTIAEVGLDSYSSNKLGWTNKIGWTTVGDSSVFPNRWPVPKPYWFPRDDLDKLRRIIYTRRPHLILL